uniref:Uncharacterized protein n=1 Tax=Phytophthora fragariae TaxID=53985 RepID=A0A6A3EY02_9STRA|nr:hypothetical protein PF009_g11810 [Phytophthora fragariae]
MVKRMGDLEAREAAGGGSEGPGGGGGNYGGAGFWMASNQYYSQAIELDPTSHILNASPSPFFEPRRPRIQATNYTGQTVTLERLAKLNRSSESHVSKRLEQLEDQASQTSASVIGS